MRMRAGVRFAWSVVLAGLVGVAAPPLAGADTMILGNGDLLTGELQLGEFPVVTVDGPTPIAARDAWRVTLGTVVGDVVELRRGGAAAGLVNEPRYTIRLRSGQTIVVSRHAVAQLLLDRR